MRPRCAEKRPDLTVAGFLLHIGMHAVGVVSIRKMDDSAKSVREIVHLMRKPLIINGCCGERGIRTPETL